MTSELHIEQLLKSDKLKTISKHLAMVRSVQKDLEAIIPERFRGKFKVLRVESSTLVLSVRSSIIATQMRIIVDELIKRMKQEGGPTSKGIKRITIRMKPVTLDLMQKKKSYPIPDEIRQQMTQVAARLQDKNLARNLLKLAQSNTSHTEDSPS